MLKVLVVDDIPDNVKLLQYDLDDAGYEVLTASNGKEALRQVHEHGPQMILTDLMMPEMDGMELCRALRSSEGIGFVYVIMLTADSDRDRLIEALEAGADDFLSKPFYHPELMARLSAGVRIVKLENEITGERRALHKANAELSVVNDKLDRLATTDVLTGLSNRYEAMRRLKDHWAAASRGGQPLSCMMFDIDHFKNCNDTYGHDAGDAVLCAVAQCIQKVSRQNEMPFRIGGEEFLVLCPSATRAEVEQGAERLRAAVESIRIQHGGVELSATVSVGVASREENMSDSAEMLKLADSALYVSKNNGRNRVTVSGSIEAGASTNEAEDSHCTVERVTP